MEGGNDAVFFVMIIIGLCLTILTIYASDKEKREAIERERTREENEQKRHEEKSALLMKVLKELRRGRGSRRRRI